MRKNIRLVALCAAALTLASCAKEIATPDPVEKEASLFNMTVYAGDDTKTEIESDGAGGYKVNWLSGDMLGVYEVGNGVVQDKTVSSPLTAGGSTAAFEFAFAGAPAAPYDYTFVYPASALGKVGENYLVTLPGTQTFAEGSFDMDADVLVSEHVQSDVRPTSTDVRFARLGATVKMTVNAPVTTENIRKIVFSTTEANIVGSYVLNPQTGALADDMVSGSKAITLTPETATVYSGNIVVWFRVAEVTLSQNFTVSVTTDAKTYTKTINLAAKERQLPFRDGKMAMVGIDLTDVSGVENTRVDVIDLAYTGVSGTTYTAWEKKGSKSEAEYKGKTNETSGVMGLRTTNSDCGIVTTVSGGKVKQVTITLKPTGYKRTIDVYAKNTAYSDVSDLYSDSKLIQGNKIGSVSVAAAATENVTETVVFTSDYNFVGIRSYNSAAAVPEIRISWEGTPVPSVSTGEATDIHANGATLSGSYAGASGGIYEAGFYWDTDASDLEDIAHKEQKITVDGSALTSGNFSGEIGSLDEVTTYYFRAYVLWLDVEENTYKEFLGPILEFTTHAKAYVPGGWLEMPAYTVDGMNGTTTSSLGDLYPLTHYATMNDKQQRNYSLLYDPEMYASYWVAYPLCSSHLGTGRSSNPFDYDPDVPSEKQTKLSSGAYGITFDSGNYTSQTYSRGHQIPNADRNGCEDMRVQTYYATNITPQLQNGFNGSIWGSLEENVRACVSGSDTVYVVTGAAFRKKGGSETIKTIVSTRDGKTLPIPNYYWKVLLKVKWSGDIITNAKAVGFWLEHKDDYVKTKAKFSDYVVSVDQIEEWTGFDFFHNLSDTLENGIESSTDWNAFKTF